MWADFHKATMNPNFFKGNVLLDLKSYSAYIPYNFYSTSGFFYSFIPTKSFSVLFYLLYQNY